MSGIEIMELENHYVSDKLKRIVYAMITSQLTYTTEVNW